MRNILADHAVRYPSWAVEDVYKLVHQAAMGSEHAVKDEAAAAAWLERERRQMGQARDEPLLDPISPDGQIVRVHLRPFCRRGLKARWLLTAFLRTAREVEGSRALLEHTAGMAVELAQEGRLGVANEALGRFFAAMRAKGYPAVHHSATYLECYRPAYRVVARRFLHAEVLEAS